MVEQSSLLKVRLEAAREESATTQMTTTAVTEMISAPRVQDRAGNITGFQRLRLVSFSGTENLLGRKNS